MSRMGRHKEPIILSLRTRPQILLNHTSLNAGSIKANKLSNEIKEFQGELRSKQPLTEKAPVFQKWKKNITLPATANEWMLLLKFLVDDCVYFAEDRERIASSSGHNVASWRTQNQIADNQREHMDIETPDTKPPKPQAFQPALNQALWDRYQGMNQMLSALTPDVDHITSDKEIGLYHIFLKAKDFLSKKHVGAEPYLGQTETARLRTLMKEKLVMKQLFSHEDIIDVSEFYLSLHCELICSDPHALTHALIWFFHLANPRLLSKGYRQAHIDPVKYEKIPFSSRSYSSYCERFLELQRLFPPRKDQKLVTEIQRELFLLMTGLFRKGCDDPVFHNLTVVRFYKKICEVANQRSEPDPAILWSYPWGGKEKAEYRQTGDIAIYHILYETIMKSSHIIKAEKRNLENELKAFLAGEDDQSPEHKIYLLHDLATLSKSKTLDQNGGICYKDSTNKPDFFNDPVKLPKEISAAERRYLPRCIREYTALSLFQAYFMEEIKSTALHMLTSPYRSQ